MTFSEFDKIMQDFHKKELTISASKGKEYANSDDRLANFKRVATTLDISPLKVAYIYFKKHLDAIEYVIQGKKELSETFESRILDARVYLNLIYAIHLEEIQSEGKERFTNGSPKNNPV